MKVALIGFGKMGKAIADVAEERGHSIVLTIDADNTTENTSGNLQLADVAIEFTNAGTAAANLKKCIDAKVPVVCGTTGWMDELKTVEDYCRAQQGTMLYASNFSIGVNIFFEINKVLAGLMARHREYNVTLEEIHHTQKLDAPSGTAITLAESILASSDYKKRWVNTATHQTEELEIISRRIDPAPGTHSVKYSSAVDDIEIIHTAHSRKGFALGAVLAAEFIAGKKGVFCMADVLNISNSTHS